MGTIDYSEGEKNSIFSIFSKFYDLKFYSIVKENKLSLKCVSWRNPFYLWILHDSNWHWLFWSSVESSESSGFPQGALQVPLVEQIPQFENH